MSNRPTMQSFVDFIQAKVGNMERVTNGNKVRITRQEMWQHAPLTLTQGDFYKFKDIAKFLQSYMDLKLEYDLYSGDFDIWFEPLERNTTVQRATVV